MGLPSASRTVAISQPRMTTTDEVIDA